MVLLAFGIIFYGYFYLPQNLSCLGPTLLVAINPQLLADVKHTPQILTPLLCPLRAKVEMHGGNVRGLKAGEIDKLF